MPLDHPLLQDLNLLDILTISLFFFLGATFAAMYFQRKISVLKKRYRALYESAELDALENQDKEKENFVDQLQREREFHERRYAELQATKNHMRDQFKAVAIEEFQHQTRELQHQNKEQLELILTPLKERLEQLDAAVSKNNLAGEKNKVFMEEISRNLIEKADKIGTDAVELARALKGSSKLQGDWGEMILENILSYAGLTKGQEYSVQPSYANASGEQLRPDLVIHYPQGQSLILDSKVSLTAYSRLVNTSDESERAQHLKQHLISVRTHIKQLSGKNYPEVVPQAFNYVLLFFPNEGAYIEALQAAPELLEESQRHNVLLTSPTNLIMSIKLCYYLWQRDRQSKNLEQIVRDCTDIYHKFVSFMGLFIQIDKSLDKAKEKYDEAYRLLASGRGNITRRLDQLRRLGVTPNKQLPESILDAAESAEEDDAELSHLNVALPAREETSPLPVEDELEALSEEVTPEAPLKEIHRSEPVDRSKRERRPYRRERPDPITTDHPDRSRREVASPLEDRRLPRNEIVADRQRYERRHAQQPAPAPAPQPRAQDTPADNLPSQSDGQLHASENISPVRERREILEKIVADSKALSTSSSPSPEPHHHAEMPLNTRITPTTAMQRETSAEDNRRARLDSRMAEVDRRLMRHVPPSREAAAPSSPRSQRSADVQQAYPSLRESLVAEAERRYFMERDRGTTASQDQAKVSGYHDQN